LEENPFGYIKDQKVFRKGFQSNPDREIGVVKLDDQTSFEYFVKRFSIIEEKVRDIQQQIKESKNKGSFLVKLVHIKDNLPNFDAIGDFTELLKRLEKSECHLRELIDLNRLKNLETKRSLILELEEQLQSTEFKATSVKVREIQNRWIQTGEVDAREKNNLDSRYQEIVSEFYWKRDQNNLDRQKIFDEIEARYESFVTDAAKLLKANQPVKTFEKFNELRKEWKSLGRLPSVKYNQYLNEFKRLNDRAYKDFDRDRKHQRKKNKKLQKEGLEKRRVILAEARKLLNQPLETAYSKSRELLDDWKSIRKGSSNEHSTLSVDFFSICNRISELNFLENLFIRKNKGYQDLGEKEQLNIRIKLLKELIRRDKNDLKKFYENKGTIRSGTGAFDLLIVSKINQQENMISLKESILLELTELSRGNSDI